MKLGSKLLKDATNEEIKKFARSFHHGYEFSNEDCIELRKSVAPCHNPDEETIKEAVDDFIRAYEG